MKRSIGQPEGLEGSNEEITKGTLIWYQDGSKEPYRRGIVQDITKKCAVILDNEYNVKLEVELDKVSRADCDFDLADCAELKCLTYPNVLENLKARYEKAYNEPRKIYTNAGWVLLCINPYHTTESLYTDEVCEEYFKQPLGVKPPHPFAIASTAFEHLIADGESQYILVSGESGGGKTECSKHLLKYLTWVTWRNRQLRGRQSLTGGRRAGECRLSALLLASNPILEFFGNAKTMRNNNSSRFGKLYKLFYTTEGDLLTSAELATYLLAKSRVVNVPNGEENYHIFHALVNNVPLDHSMIEKDGPLELVSSSASVPGTSIGLDVFGDDISHFSSPFLGNDEDSDKYADPAFNFHLSRLVEAFDLFDVDASTQYRIFRTLAGLLYLGSVIFVEGFQKEAKIADMKPLEKAMELWEMPGQAPKLLEVLTKVPIRETTKVLTASKSTSLLHSLCKGVYECLFHEVIVKLVKEKLKANESIAVEVGSGCVGVLDLFGFENLDNGFEQLCINYANEELHNHFMTKLITNEIQVLTQEGIVSESAVELYQSHINNGALTYFTGNPSIFTILEEASRLNHQDTEFNRRVTEFLNSQLSKGGKKRKLPSELDLFTVQHYAEPVTYNCEGFVQRNSDYLSQSLIDFLQSYPQTFVGHMFPQTVVKSKKAATISETFRKQMSNLLHTLRSVECYFIKCIKPNGTQSAFGVDIWSIHRQLTTGGVSPMLQLMRAGYPCRLNFNTLHKKFNTYFPAISQLRPSEFAELILQFLDVPADEYKIGLSKVFFRFGVYHQVEKCLLAVSEDDKTRRQFCDTIIKYRRVWLFYQISSALTVVTRLKQKLIRRRQRLKWKRLAEDVARYYNEQWKPERRNRAATKIQVWFRTNGIWRIFFLRRIRAIFYIQLWWKDRLLLRYLRSLDAMFERKRCMRVVLAVLRGCCLRIQRRNELHRTAATIIQKYVRGYLIRRSFRKLSAVQRHVAAIAIQSLLRRYLQWPKKQRIAFRERVRAAGLESCRTPCNRTPLQGRTPVKRDKTSSPEFGTCKSRRAKTATGLATNPEFKRAIDYWEIETDHRLPAKEKLRRRLSVLNGSSDTASIPSNILGRLLRSARPRVSTVDNPKPVTPLRVQTRSLADGSVLQQARAFEQLSKSHTLTSGEASSRGTSVVSSTKRSISHSRLHSRAPSTTNSAVAAQGSRLNEELEKQFQPRQWKQFNTTTGDTGSDDGFQTAREFVPQPTTPLAKAKEEPKIRSKLPETSGALCSITKKHTGSSSEEKERTGAPVSMTKPVQPIASRFSFAQTSKESPWMSHQEPLTEVISDDSEGALFDMKGSLRKRDEPGSMGIATEVIEKEINNRIGDASSSDSLDDEDEDIVHGTSYGSYGKGHLSSLASRTGLNQNAASKSPRFTSESSVWNPRLLSHTYCSFTKTKQFDESLLNQISRNKKPLVLTDYDRSIPRRELVQQHNQADNARINYHKPPLRPAPVSSDQSFEPSSEVPDEFGGRTRQSIRAWRRADDETPLLRKQQIHEEDTALVSKEANTPLFGESRRAESRSVSLSAALSGIENAPPTNVADRLKSMLQGPVKSMKLCNNPSGHSASK